MIRHGVVAYLAALLVLFALTPFPVARAWHPFGGGGGAVVLRYRFVPGQTTSYTVATRQRSVVASSTAAPDAPLAALAQSSVATYVASDQEHRQVLSVDAAGNSHTCWYACYGRVWIIR